MKRLLIIGASILQLPAIKKAKEMGLEVAVADFNPKAIGIAYADHYFNVSTNDIEGIVKISEEYHPDGIVTLATDMPMRSIAAATQKLGLPGLTMDTALKATDKCEMIKAFKANGVASPWFYVIDRPETLDIIKDELSYPCIMKPVDNSGSRGVILIHTLSDIKNAYDYSRSESRNGEVIIEEYLEGQEISVEIIVFNGEIHILQVTDKLTTGAPNFVEMGHSQPSQFTDKNLLEIQKLAVDAVKAIGIENGPAHVEMMVTEDGPKMIELGARLGGDCITTHLVPLSTGIDMVKATIDIALGYKPEISPIFKHGSAIRYFDVPCGKIFAIDGADEARKIQGVHDVTFTKGVGDTVTPIHSSLDRVGMVIAEGDDALDAINKCEKALDKIKISVG